MIIVDDASPDTTWNIIEEHAARDGRIVPIRLANNSGPAVARNTAIRASSGELVAFLDSDDTWLPGKLERQVEFMQQAGIDFSFSWYERIDEQGHRKGRVVTAPSVVRHKDLLKSNYIGCLTAMYRKSAFPGLLMPEIPVHQDWGFWLELTRDGQVAHCIPEVLALYRHSYSETVSSNKLKTLRHKWRIYRSVEGLGIFRSLYYMAHLGVRGVKKSRI